MELKDGTAIQLFIDSSGGGEALVPTPPRYSGTQPSTDEERAFIMKLRNETKGNCNQHMKLKNCKCTCVTDLLTLFKDNDKVARMFRPFIDPPEELLAMSAFPKAAKPRKDLTPEELALAADAIAAFNQLYSIMPDKETLAGKKLKLHFWHFGVTHAHVCAGAVCHHCATTTNNTPMHRFHDPLLAIRQSGARTGKNEKEKKKNARLNVDKLHCPHMREFSHQVARTQSRFVSFSGHCHWLEKTPALEADTRKRKLAPEPETAMPSKKDIDLSVSEIYGLTPHDTPGDTETAAPAHMQGWLFEIGDYEDPNKLLPCNSGDDYCQPVRDTISSLKLNALRICIPNHAQRISPVVECLKDKTAFPQGREGSELKHRFDAFPIAVKEASLEHFAAFLTATCGRNCNKEMKQVPHVSSLWQRKKENGSNGFQDLLGPENKGISKSFHA